MTASTIAQFLAILLSGLVAGLLYGYDCSVIGGLGKLGDREYLQAFQAINRVIQQPYFFISFMGALFLLPLASWKIYQSGNDTAFYWMLSASLLYLVGVFGITAAGNVPLNNLLDNFDISNASPKSLAEMRAQFEGNWNRLHHLRTYASIGSFLCAILSILKYQE